MRRMPHNSRENNQNQLNYVMKTSTPTGASDLWWIRCVGFSIESFENLSLFAAWVWEARVDLDLRALGPR